MTKRQAFLKNTQAHGARAAAVAYVRTALLVGCMAGVAMLSSGCASIGFKGDKVAWDHITLVASDDVNNNSPVAIDVVFITDETMVARIAELPASKWFAARDDLVSTFPKSLQVKSWELVPGQRVELTGKSFDRPRVSAAFLFANYADSGAHRVRIQQFNGDIAVTLNTNTFAVSAVK
ncbi:hypothetical protein [Paraburkholderia sp.]|uniref:hypothetical protein n=1 Tax=Paraburkholderia sp. TaxID=1926495 RepID=UPI00238F81ED|nr:hypothetical protein [Paraburkholderia sp.]MDE1180919.1 hypothetical protein [Paraburkholderia sp.]